MINAKSSHVCAEIHRVRVPLITVCCVKKKDEKKLWKYLEDMFYSTTFAPAFERERRLNMMKKLLEKTS